MKPKYRAKTKIQVRIGGTMREWRKGDDIDLDEETVRQYLHGNDYEKIEPGEKNKKRKPSVTRHPEPVEG